MKIFRTGLLVFLLPMAAVLAQSAPPQIPPPVLQSQPLAKARTCMSQLVADGRSGNFETDSPSPASVTIMNPSLDKLRPLASKVIQCLNAALPNKEV